MQNVKITSYTEGYTDRILSLYQSVGWSNYYENPERLKVAFAHSLYIAAAYRGENMMGIIRCVGDGYSIIYIQDLLVFPADQRQGIGSKLLGHVLDHFEKVYQICLLTDASEKNIAFYKKCGLTNVSKLNCTAFMKMNV